MSAKITFIGAGSFGFTRTVLKDVLTFPRLADAEIALMDIDPERLDMSRECCQRIIDAGGYKARLKTYTNRRRALDGANAVIVTILSGDTDIWQHDILIPKKYGVDICIGDTRGPSGIFRALRTIPVMLSICKDMQEVCPDAIMLNYTNPMAMLCHAMQTVYPQLTISGLCHSVQGTANMLAQWLGKTEQDMDYVSAGLNHMSWLIKYEYQSRDMYPKLRKLVQTREDIYYQSRVRNDMFLMLGYYITEGSRHNSEYSWWFRKRPDLIKYYFTKKAPESGRDGSNAWLVKMYQRRKQTWRKELRDWINHPDWSDPAKTAERLKRGNEYASSIVNAWTGGETYTFHGNVPNHGVITNLPQGACIEVPVVARRRRLQTVHVGDLPKSVLSLTALTANNEMLAVEGALKKDARMIYQAIAYDPLTAAVLSLPEIKKMTMEMFAKNKKYLPGFKSNL
ncbi:MAG: alpha-galactosidase [Kiritimatiellia bacterium]